MKKQVFITGAAGFIGFHLAQRLHQRGDQVIGYDHFSPYYSVALKRERARLLEEQGIQVVEGDICDAPTLNHWVERHNTTHFVHLAAQAGVRYSITHPEVYIKNNVEGFLNVLECCRRRSGMPLTYASSSSVYGLNDHAMLREGQRTDHQASLYGVTKKSNELMATTYHHLFNIPVTGLRFFTVYGPWGRPDMAYYSFAKAIMEKTAIDVFNEGKLKRDFTYIDDIISGTTAAIDLEAQSEIFNLGNHCPVALLDFIEILENALGQRAIKNFIPMQAGDVLATYADNSHSLEKLGFFPKTYLEDGIGHFVEWFCRYGKKF